MKRKIVFGPDELSQTEAQALRELQNRFSASENAIIVEAVRRFIKSIYESQN